MREWLLTNSNWLVPLAAVTTVLTAVATLCSRVVRGGTSTSRRDSALPYDNAHSDWDSPPATDAEAESVPRGESADRSTTCTLVEPLRSYEYDEYEVRHTVEVEKANWKRIAILPMDVSANDEMKCPYCNTWQRIGKRVYCANRKCKAFLYAQILRDRNDDSRLRAFSWALKRNPYR